MSSFSSLTYEKLGVWCGMVLAGGALVFGGAKALEHASFQPADAKVTGTEIRCEMTSSGDRQRVTQMVMCGDVATVKAQNPNVEWRITAEPVVTLAYTTATGEQVWTKVALSALNRNTTVAGDRIGILYQADRPTHVSAQASPTFFAANGVVFIGGLLLCGFAGTRQARRDMAQRDRNAVSTLYAANAASHLPTVSSPPMWAEPAKANSKPQIA